MSTTEHTMNDVLASLLRETRKVWRTNDVVRSENTSLIKGSNARPDILILEPCVSPVVVETEVIPALTVESDALSRLGKELRGSGRSIMSVIACRLPGRLRNLQGQALRKEVAEASDLDIALLTGESREDCSRWPKSGWVQGDIKYLSQLIQAASVPPAVVEEAADNLVSGVIEAAQVLEDMDGVHPGAMHRISSLLHQEYDAQTRRMATAILANAFTFHESLAGGPGELASVRTLEELRGSREGLGRSSILCEWRKILEVNYWPIFDIARRILEVIPSQGSAYLIRILADTADKLLRKSLLRSHDLMGSVFQRLIADRKFLAAFYTKPASASLLLDLALHKTATPSGGSWANPDVVTSLKIADFACGTGTLLSTAYQRVGQLHEFAGGDAEAIHEKMMASALFGCDVLPAAAHLTASMLSGTHPSVRYTGSSILTVPYGRLDDGGVALGSLDLLKAQGSFEFLSITAKALEGLGESENKTWDSMPDESFDLVVMNPPFTRPTNHEGKHANVPNPMFGAFGSDAEEQRVMASATKQLTTGTCAHGNAGEASIFLALADRKLRQGGTLALVMPMTILSGSSWEKSRKLLKENYSELVVVTIAGEGSQEMSFSADTGMAECLLIGRKTKVSKKARKALFIVLNESPQNSLNGSAVAREVANHIFSQKLRDLEDGPYGATKISIGDDHTGQMIRATLPASGGWGLVRISDFSLAQTAHQLLSCGQMWFPLMSESEAVRVPICILSDIAEIGPVDRDVNGTNSDGSIRGPYQILDYDASDIPTYPVLWAHNAERERTIQFSADKEGIVRTSQSEDEQAWVNSKAERVWNSASNCHSNRDFQFNSQSTAMQFTPRKTIGGRAWLSVKLDTPELEKVLVLWANTTPGLLLRWWHSSKQQSGRGILTKTTTGTCPVLDVTTLNDTQLKNALQIFDDIADKSMKPINEIDSDTVRKELDQRFLSEVLCLDAALLELNGPLDILRKKLGQEPSVRGSKIV